MTNNKTGTLSIRTYTAGGALPVPGSIIRIIGVDEDNSTIEYSLMTDIDGITPLITLPAPDVLQSQSPSPTEAPFSQYDIVITNEGFYTKKIHNVPIFDGINSIQQVNMIPLSETNNKSDFPRNNLDVVIKENRYLE